MLFFFFSSRRRHTRYWRDWSSDVCSSDLLDDVAGRVGGDGVPVGGHGLPLAIDLLFEPPAAERRGETDGAAGGQRVVGRSEERRVGEECRSRWAAYHLKKKNKEMRDTVSD